MAKKPGFFFLLPGSGAAGLTPQEISKEAEKNRTWSGSSDELFYPEQLQQVHQHLMFLMLLLLLLHASRHHAERVSSSCY